MKINDLVKGVYVSADFDAGTKRSLYAWAKLNAIPSVIASDKFHCTVLYSRKDVPNVTEIVQHVAPATIKIKPLNFNKFDEDKVLVLELESSALSSLHKSLIANGGTHDYESYTPHVTLSYKLPAEYDISELMIPEFEFRVDRLVIEPLDLEWPEARK
tara:strand:- start:341 stop:814 length:474 start_codon:yes stop_codon:yes gene_type:complete